MDLYMTGMHAHQALATSPVQLIHSMACLSKYAGLSWSCLFGPDGPIQDSLARILSAANPRVCNVHFSMCLSCLCMNKCVHMRGRHCDRLRRCDSISLNTEKVVIDILVRTQEHDTCDRRH
jgi:hypothetical protein